MKNIVVRNALMTGLVGLAAIVVGGSFSTVSAQGSQDRAVDQAQQAVRRQIVRQEGGRNVSVDFNSDAQTDVRSRSEIRVSGTGTLSRNDSRGNDPRGNDPRNNDSRYGAGRSREFSYEALVSRNRFGGVSGVRYDLRGDRSDNGDRNNRRDGDANRDNGRDNGRDNRRDNDRGGYGNGNRPAGRVSYSGPIMNRHSDKGLDVLEQSNREGANIQQWSFADQPNQNWDVIDLGNGESAIISRQSGRAITVQGGRDSNGANIIQQSWRGSPQQRWRFEQTGGDYYRIVSVDNGKVLDVTQAGKENGANIQLWDYANQANQQWRLRR